ncbi:MAG: ArnT family glycosyltransferase [Acetatifactor sp.]
MKELWRRYGRNPVVWLIPVMTIGCLARVLYLGSNPMGLHQDEAYSAYNAWSVLNYGVDSFGYTRPVYYTVWGSGMSVLYSWLTMPFFAIWGISTWTIRLPQAILGCICIPVMYGLGEELFASKWKGLACAALLAINPWHIQQSRVGFDCNLAVPMLLFAMYFWCRYLNGKRRSIWGAAVFFGLTLYCYVLTWILIPAILLLSVIFFRKRISFDRSLVLSALLLFVMALPLMLFLAVNMGWIPEVRTSLVSIPKLPALRTNEMSLKLGDIRRRFDTLVYILVTQHDDRWWISNATVGSYYYVTTPFIVLGILSHVKLLFDRIFRRKQLPMHFMVSLWFGASFLLGCLVDKVFYHKINYIHIPIILYGVMGILCVAKVVKKTGAVAALAVAVYTVCFGCFVYSHATFPVNYEAYGYNAVCHMNWYQYEEALDKAKEVTDGSIYVFNLNYANVMLYEQISPYDYMETVKYKGDPKFLEVSSFGRYCFNTMPEEGEDAAIVYVYAQEDGLRSAGYTTIHADECYGVAYKEKEK